jgi:cytochrome c-type biogenesis protein CcmH/NrfG
MDIEQTYQLGFQLRCDGKYAEAKQVFERLLSTNPGHLNSRHQIALIKGFEGDFDGSLADLQQLTAQAPANLNIRYDLAMTQMMLGMYEEACANFRYILSVDPAHEKANQQIIYC